MNHGPSTLADEVERYLLTGSSHPVYSAWPGNIVERATRGHDELRAELISAVRLREVKRTDAMPAGLDAVALTRSKVEPMVVGLFPRAERDVVLAMLENSVVFLTSENIENVLLKESFNHSAWTLANLYLAGLGAELLSQDAPNVVGLSQDTKCYVSPQYFHEEDLFADFIVHEAAHVFHKLQVGQAGTARDAVKGLAAGYRIQKT